MESRKSLELSSAATGSLSASSERSLCGSPTLARLQGWEPQTSRQALLSCEANRGTSMSSSQSEQVLTLLKELSLLKELDCGYEAGSKTGTEQTAHQLRQQRHRGD